MFWMMGNHAAIYVSGGAVFVASLDFSYETNSQYTVLLFP
jgi:hypothetical protein